MIVYKLLDTVHRRRLTARERAVSQQQRQVRACEVALDVKKSQREDALTRADVERQRVDQEFEEVSLPISRLQLLEYRLGLRHSECIEAGIAVDQAHGQLDSARTKLRGATLAWSAQSKKCQKVAELLSVARLSEREAVLAAEEVEFADWRKERR